MIPDENKRFQNLDAMHDLQPGFQHRLRSQELKRLSIRVTWRNSQERSTNKLGEHRGENQRMTAVQSSNRLTLTGKEAPAARDESPFRRCGEPSAIERMAEGRRA